MAINLFNIKKWYNMIRGNSSYHVNQSEGLCYSVKEISGYYNNLTEKILRFAMPNDDIPVSYDSNGLKQFFSIAIFQYGLAAFDLWLMRKESNYLRKFKNCVDWAFDNQNHNGSWNTFAHKNPNCPFSAMAQGEGISLLVRAYKEFGDVKYLKAAEKAFIFLMTPRANGGVCDETEKELLLYEVTDEPLVLNGWIFASWGLLDYYKSTNNIYALRAWEKTISSMIQHLPKFDAVFWSYYNEGHAFTSQFYHKLHISQLQAMYKLTNRIQFLEYSKKWDKQLQHPIKKGMAFIIKSLQKIIE